MSRWSCILLGASAALAVALPCRAAAGPPVPTPASCHAVTWWNYRQPGAGADPGASSPSFQPRTGAELGASSPSLALGPVGVRALSMAGGSLIGGRLEETLFRSELRLERGGAARGAWLGAGMQQGSTSQRAAGRAIFDAGLWAMPRGLAISLGIQHRNEVIPTAGRWTLIGSPDSASSFLSFEPQSSRAASVTTVEPELRWSRGRFDLELSGGLAIGDRIIPARWERAGVSWWPQRAFAITVSAAAGVPPWLTLVPSARSGLLIGMRVEPTRVFIPRERASAEHPRASQPLRMRSMGRDRTGFALRLPDARRVEMRGDFTGWEPLVLAGTGSGWWEATVQVAPGLHEIEIRVDGGDWRPPPGLPTTLGAFDSQVGVIVVK